MGKPSGLRNEGRMDRLLQGWGQMHRIHDMQSLQLDGPTSQADVGSSVQAEGEWGLGVRRREVPLRVHAQSKGRNSGPC